MPDKLPAPLALFPLQSVLFPGGWLRLRVFEPRYLDLMRRCEAQGLPFGVVGLVEGSEVRERDGEGFRRERFHDIGTLAELVRIERPQAGLLNICARGTRRFRLLSSECLSHGLWVGQAEMLAADPRVSLPGEFGAVAQLLRSLLHRLETGAAAADVPIQPPYDWDDCGWLANRWCELLPLPDAERQHLMALDNPLLRLELVADQLDVLGVQ
ncbi:MAG: LON peptidase substrate-binding domain-containing protein [Paucibacter sp.]|nr:LON peptidase substrate-binding domain-containing protein [Roseateles sp.]